MGSVEDSCVICADPLHFTGIGPCGHKEVCSRCVTRLRFVMQSKKCALCQQDAPNVFFTQFMGDFTSKIPAEQYPDLKVSDSHDLPIMAGLVADPDAGWHSPGKT
jgi:E3 ubiquitin-protein ligase ZNF598